LIMFAVVKNRKQPRRKKVVDLYCHMSRALYYDIDTRELIRDEEARKIYDSICATKQKSYESIDYKQGVKADVWRNGKPATISGNIYTI
jgi:hypothetical protein